MMLLEKDKYGQSLIDTLTLNEVSYCIMDHFAGNMDGIKTGALDKATAEALAENINFPIRETVDGLYDDLRVGMTEKQKENYYKGLIKRLHIEIVDSVLKVVWNQIKGFGDGV